MIWECTVTMCQGFFWLSATPHFPKLYLPKVYCQNVIFRSMAQTILNWAYPKLPHLPSFRKFVLLDLSFILKSFSCLPDLFLGWQAGCMAAKWSLMGTLPCSAILCQPRICFTILSHAYLCFLPLYYFTMVWAISQMLIIFTALYSILHHHCGTAHFCVACITTSSSDPFTFNLSTHTDTQYTTLLWET